MYVSRRKHLANRVNAQSSTGPRTLAGKKRSSQNRLRHGLAIPSGIAPNTLTEHAHLKQCFQECFAFTALKQRSSSARLSNIVDATMNVMPGSYDEPASRLAAAIIDLGRLRRARAGLITKLQINPEDTNVGKDLTSLLRYDRRFSSQFRRALRLAKERLT
jgi:hypothetical protein